MPDLVGLSKFSFNVHGLLGPGKYLRVINNNQSTSHHQWKLPSCFFEFLPGNDLKMAYLNIGFDV